MKPSSLILVAALMLTPFQTRAQDATQAFAETSTVARLPSDSPNQHTERAQSSSTTAPDRTGLIPASGAMLSDPVKRALIIAVGEYPDVGLNGYSSINSSNDVPLIRHTLQRQGFETIAVLENAAADRAGIEAALRALEAETQPGDVVVIHFSGHGVTMRDDNADETDGYDEALVPYGARHMPDASAGETLADVEAMHLRDDDFGEHLVRIRRAAGGAGHVSVWLDSCHSGSGTRSANGAKARGVSLAVGQAPPSDQRRADLGISPEAGGLLEGKSGASGGLASIVLISAARHDQLNYETTDRANANTPVGSLSLALRDAFARVGPEDTYGMLFDDVRATLAAIAPHQTPQIEGDPGIDLRVLDGRARAQDPYFRIIDYDAQERTVYLDGGTFTGLNVGAKIAIHPTSTATLEDAGTPLAVGTVTDALETQVEVTLDAPLPEDTDASRTRAFVTQASYGDVRLRVHVAGDLPGTLGADLRERLAEFGMVALVDTPNDADLLVASQAAEPVARGGSKAPLQGGVYVTDATTRTPIGSVLVAADAAPTDAAVRTVETRLQDYARYRFLVGMGGEHAEEAGFRMEVVPARHVIRMGRYVRSETEGVTARREGGSLVMEPGEDYLLRVTNDGDEGAYVTVLDLLSDGSIQPLVPNADITTAETLIEPGRSIQVPMRITVPVGPNTLRLFVTSEPVDFRPMLTRGSTRSRGPANPLEVLFDNVTTGEVTTRGTTLGGAPGEYATSAVTIQVVLAEENAEED